VLHVLNPSAQTHYELVNRFSKYPELRMKFKLCPGRIYSACHTNRADQHKGFEFHVAGILPVVIFGAFLTLREYLPIAAEANARDRSTNGRATRFASMITKVLTTAALVAALLAPAAILPAAQASAQDEVTLPTAAISLGDSYLSGEAGRWQGNSSSDWADRNGTDRAATPRRWFGWRYDQELVYGDSYATGCNRSDVAPLLSADLDVDAVFNLACAGATTTNVISASSGGRSHNGEAPQADQLAAIAQDYDIEVVALSVGGNDLGFSDVIIDCIIRYTTSTRFAPNTCALSQSISIGERMPAAMEGVAQSIVDIREALALAGDDDYRIVLNGYPVPIPSGDEFRYPETGFRRTFTGGCPFWDSDADWANDVLLPTIRENLIAVAEAQGVEFLDLSDALAGREACAEGASQGSGPNAEWIRFVTTGIGQGDADESVHPNFYGQLALGRCLALHVDAGPGDSRCLNTPGESAAAMVLER